MTDYKYNTKILSWNIQSSNTISGSKFNDPEFCEILQQHDIICLQETRQCVKVPGFRAFNNTRDSEKHGGVCTLIKNSIKDGVHRISSKYSDMVICKMKQAYFNLVSDVYIINIYVKPANTSCKTADSSGMDTLHALDSIINDLQGQGEIILCGDFNARISNELDFILNDEDNTDSYIPLPDDYIPDNIRKRSSQDRKTNSYKRTFLDLLTNNRIHILNGRTLGDFKGQFTCIQPTGSSVVDYFIASPNIRQLVNHLTVMPFTIFSDHKPLSLSLKLNSIITKHSKLGDVYDKAPVRYKFCDSSKESYRDVQYDSEMVNIVDDITKKVYDNNTDGTYHLNKDFTNYIRTIADKTLTKTKHNTTNIVNKKPWFNTDCRTGKRFLNKAARIVSQFPDSDYLRQNYYKVKKQYKSILKKNKSGFFNRLNTDIENGKVLNWKQFKRLKVQKSASSQFDTFDMANFEHFFKNLYSNNHQTISSDKKQELLREADQTNADTSKNYEHCSSGAQTNILNSEFSLSEITSSIKALKNGKSSSSDLVCNELLKNLNDNGIIILQKLYNKCLETGSYPWNNSIISPLHKKGSKENPDNYRAVAVSSTIGKLFSTILLERLIKFRNSNCPDPPNQLGFTKGAQTYDHIFTLNTVTSKYRKLRKKVHTVFVDFKKAFDSVCREALFFKLSKLGITGNFYNVLRHMYSNSTAQIKLSGHVSNMIPINKGTEQGHPLSPDLFKIFLSDLSPLLELPNCPNLMGKLISHLLWADDLILLALDHKTLQTQLNILDTFCRQWGIDINVSKTKVMIFNNNNNRGSFQDLYLGNRLLEVVDSYCYLGINIHNSGSFTLARHELRKKAMRSLYGLKNTVNKTKLSHRSLCTLFDSLIKPIILYGAPIWCPSMSVVKTLGKIFNAKNGSNNVNDINLPRKISLLDCEKVHLHFLKWSLGINRRSSNIGAWGETGRYPLVYECINLTLKYIKRLKSCDNNTLVSLAFKEQQASNLEWFRNIEPILKIDSTYTTDHVTIYKNTHCSPDTHCNTQAPTLHTIVHNGITKYIPPQTIKPIISRRFTPFVILKTLKLHFRDTWQYTKSRSPKLEFYNRAKIQFNKEIYLDHVNNFYDRANLTKLRISAHALEVETGRYKNIAREERHCNWCKISTGAQVIEDESHVLYTCDLYSKLRQQFLNRVSEHSGTAVTHIDYMSLLNTCNSIEYDNPNNIARDHQTMDTLSAIFIVRAIAKLVTRSFDLAKQLSAKSSLPSLTSITPHNTILD